MRLIDESDVIRAVDKHTTDDDKLDEDISVILEEVKTAFDKEKVIKELQKMKGVPHDDSVAEIVSTQIWNKALQKAIKIIEKGGIE